MCFFKFKKIVSVVIIEEIDGLDEDEQLENLVVGDMIGGFDGMVCAEIYNQDHSAQTVFLVTYDDGSQERILTDNGSRAYRRYINLM